MFKEKDWIFRSTSYDYFEALVEFKESGDYISILNYIVIKTDDSGLWDFYRIY